MEIEEEKEDFEFGLAQHRHGEIVELLKSIQFQAKESDALRLVTRQLDALLKKVYLPEFGEFVKGLNSQIADLQSELSENAKIDQSAIIEKLLTEWTQQLKSFDFSVFAEEMRLSLDKLNLVITELKKPKTFIVHRDKSKLITKVTVE
jgi:hypothetical protein